MYKQTILRHKNENLLVHKGTRMCTYGQTDDRNCLYKGRNYHFEYYLGVFHKSILVIITRQRKVLKGTFELRGCFCIFFCFRPKTFEEGQSISVVSI